MLTTKQSENYTRQHMLNYDYIKNHHRLKAIDLSQQKKKKKKDADVKAILEIEFVEQLKTSLGLKPDGTQSMFVLTILEKIKGTKLKVSQVREIVL